MVHCGLWIYFYNVTYSLIVPVTILCAVGLGNIKMILKRNFFNRLENFPFECTFGTLWREQ